VLLEDVLLDIDLKNDFDLNVDGEIDKSECLLSDVNIRLIT
jgi:hypothetical protein